MNGMPQIRANRYLWSQTLYNECALVTKNELVDKRNLQRENILFLTCKNNLQGGPYSRSWAPPAYCCKFSAKIWYMVCVQYNFTYSLSFSKSCLKHPIRNWNCTELLAIQKLPLLWVGLRGVAVLRGCCCFFFFKRRAPKRLPKRARSTFVFVYMFGEANRNTESERW